MEKELAALDRHLLVCGSGQTAIYTAQELVSVKRPVVMVVDRPEKVGAIRAVLQGVPILVGDPSEDEILLAAVDVRKASGTEMLCPACGARFRAPLGDVACPRCEVRFRIELRGSDQQPVAGR